MYRNDSMSAETSRRRISAADALKHDYLKQFHNEFVERDAPCTVKVSIPDEERRSTNLYRERLYKEVAEFRKAEEGKGNLQRTMGAQPHRAGRR